MQRVCRRTDFTQTRINCLNAKIPLTTTKPKAEFAVAVLPDGEKVTKIDREIRLSLSLQRQSSWIVEEQGLEWNQVRGEEEFL